MQNVVEPNKVKAAELEEKIKNCQETCKELDAEHGRLNEASKPAQASGNATQYKYYRDLMKANREQYSAVLRNLSDYREQLEKIKVTNQIN